MAALKPLLAEERHLHGNIGQHILLDVSNCVSTEDEHMLRLEMAGNFISNDK